MFWIRSILGGLVDNHDNPRFLNLNPRTTALNNELTFVIMGDWIRIVYSTKSSELWSSQLWTQFMQLRKEAWKSQDFNRVWTRDLAIPVRRSNQLSYEAIN